MTAPAWVRPTARLLPWGLLVLPAVGAAAAARLLQAAHVGPPTLAATGVLATVAAGVAASVDDPARAMTDALPVGRRRQAGRRLALATPVALAGWLLASHALVPRLGIADALGLASSLAAAAVAAGVIADRIRPRAGVVAGSALPLGVASASVVYGPDWGPLGLWTEHPWAVFALASAAAITALRP